MTVKEWFEYWSEFIICDLSPNTCRNYRERFEINIQPVIGQMRISDVKPMHCKAVLNRMMENMPVLQYDRHILQWQRCSVRQLRMI